MRSAQRCARVAGLLLFCWYVMSVHTPAFLVGAEHHAAHHPPPPAALCVGVTHCVVRWQLEQGPTKLAVNGISRYNVWHVKDPAEPEGPSMLMVVYGRSVEEMRKERYCTGDVIHVARAKLNFPVRCLPIAYLLNHVRSAPWVSSVEEV